MDRFEKNNKIVIALNAVIGEDSFSSEKNGPYDTPVISYKKEKNAGTWFPWRYNENSMRTFMELVHELMEMFEHIFKNKDVTSLFRLAKKLDEEGE